MSGHSGNPLVSLDVGFATKPPQGMVTPLCQSLSEACRSVLADADAAARLRLTAHELLENIVKYSALGGGAFHFRLEREGPALRATFETRNVPAPDRRQDAEGRLAALTAAQDPLEHYDSIIADSARQPAGSGLGLARIHAETEYRLSHRFEGDVLVICASGEVWHKAGGSP
jgi:hypothetical protein